MYQIIIMKKAVIQLHVVSLSSLFLIYLDLFFSSLLNYTYAFICQ